MIHFVLKLCVVHGGPFHNNMVPHIHSAWEKIPIDQQNLLCGVAFFFFFGEMILCFCNLFLLLHFFFFFLLLFLLLPRSFFIFFYYIFFFFAFLYFTFSAFNMKAGSS